MLRYFDLGELGYMQELLMVGIQLCIVKKEGKWIRKKGIDNELIITLKVQKRKGIATTMPKLPIERI